MIFKKYFSGLCVLSELCGNKILKFRYNILSMKVKLKNRKIPQGLLCNIQAKAGILAARDISEGKYIKYFSLKVIPHIYFTCVLVMVFSLLAGIVTAQPEKIREALEFLHGGEFDKAKEAIDIASENEQTANEAKTWYYKGFIYKEIYNQLESSNPTATNRPKSVMFFKKAILFDKDGKWTKGSNGSIKFLATTYYNDAVRTLDYDNYKIAIANFNKYKETIVIAEPEINLDEKNIAFYKALASLYTNIYESDKKQHGDFWVKARDAYEKVLEVDPNNLSANYNTGILYYNKAVNIINQTEYDIDLVGLSDIQDTCVVLFKQSLPYMETAYKLQPDNRNTLIGLSGIYFGLNEVEKSEIIKKELESLQQK
ncbi:MAG: hypothetical protein ABII90_10120 [Bacteroidota bacterium]